MYPAPLNSVINLVWLTGRSHGRRRSLGHLCGVLSRLALATQFVLLFFLPLFLVEVSTFAGPSLKRKSHEVKRRASGLLRLATRHSVHENRWRRSTIPNREERLHTSLTLGARTGENVHNDVARSAREWLGESSRVRIGLVLSGGGLRGASHVGVLQQLIEHDIPIDVMVGSSAGAIITTYYAAVG